MRISEEIRQLENFHFLRLKVPQCSACSKERRVFDSKIEALRKHFKERLQEQESSVGSRVWLELTLNE